MSMRGLPLTKEFELKAAAGLRYAAAQYDALEESLSSAFAAAKPLRLPLRRVFSSSNDGPAVDFFGRKIKDKHRTFIDDLTQEGKV
jgi:hypothetical protein